MSSPGVKLMGEGARSSLPTALRGGTFRVPQGLQVNAFKALAAPASARTSGPVSTLAPPAVQTAAPTAQTSGPVEAAAQRVRTALAEGGTGAGALALENEARALGDPAQVDALLTALAPEVDTLARDLALRARNNEDDSGDGVRRQTQTGVTSLAAVADLAGDAGVARLAASLGQAFAAHGDSDNLNQFDDVLGDLAEQGRGARLGGALAQDLIQRGFVEAGNAVLDTTTDAVGKIREDLTTAQGELAVQEQRLAADLGAFGPGLTSEQRQAYTDAFWADPSRAELRDRATGLANTLATTLEETGPALEALAAAGDSDSAKVLLESYTLLANTDAHAEAAVDFVGRVGTNAALAATIDEHTDGNLEERLQNEVLAQALPRAQAGIFARYEAMGPEGATRAAEELDALTAPLSDAKSAFKDIKREVDNFKLALGALSRFRDGASWDLSRAQTIIGAWDQQNPFQRSLAVAAVGFGIYAGAQAFAEGDYPQALQGFLGAARGGVLVASGLVGLFSRTADLAGDVARVGGRFLPAIGLALDSAQLTQDIANLRDNGTDAGEIVSLIGTGISLAGDVLEFVPGLGTVAGGVLGIVGGVVHALGGFISGLIHGNEEAQKLAEDRAKLLEQAGIPADTRELLTLDPEAAAQLGNMGLTREQFLEELRKREALFDDNDGFAVQVTDTAWRVAALYGLEGQDALDLVDALRGAPPEALDRIQQQLGPDYHFDPSTGGASPEMVRNAQEQILGALQYAFGPDLAAEHGLTVDPSDVNIGFFVASAQVG
ncbi:hypothetical protein [Corallococcus soli]|uniref:hypothetical protein n=1 Tax=Corallococcus soli TaxID=2710757 RepID=UPI00186BB689|nr:hypothetical protein [Corallococcus soli]